jgi:hypothetical protein
MSPYMCNVQTGCKMTNQIAIQQYEKDIKCMPILDDHIINEMH